MKKTMILLILLLSLTLGINIYAYEEVNEVDLSINIADEVIENPDLSGLDTSKPSSPSNAKSRIWFLPEGFQFNTKVSANEKTYDSINESADWVSIVNINQNQPSLNLSAKLVTNTEDNLEGIIMEFYKGRLVEYINPPKLGEKYVHLDYENEKSTLIANGESISILELEKNKSYGYFGQEFKKVKLKVPPFKGKAGKKLEAKIIWKMTSQVIVD